MRNYRNIVIMMAALQAAIFCRGQDYQGADTLIRYLNDNISDSLRIEYLKNIARFSPNPDIMLLYSHQLDSIGIAWNDPELRIRAFQCMHNAWREKGNLNESLRMLYLASDIAIEHGLEIKVGQIQGQLALIHTSNGDHRKALEANLLSNDIFKNAEDSMSIMSAYMNTGYSYFKLGLYDSAIVHYELGEQINASLQQDWAKAYFLGNKALVKMEQGKLVEAKAELNEAIRIIESSRYDVIAVSDFSINLGKVHYQLKDYSEAISAAKRGYELSKKSDNKTYIRDAAELLSQIYQDLGDYQNSLRYYQEFIANRDTIQNTETVKNIANQQAEYEIGLKQAEVDLLEAQRETQRIILWGLGIGLGLFLIFSIIIFRFYQAKNKLSKELSRQKEELEKLNNTKDKFFSIISHDLRSPVAAFMGVSRMIKILVQNKKTDDLLELTEEIDQSVDRLSGLLDNLLNWATQQQGDMPNIPEKINTREMMDSLVGVFRNMANSKQIELSSSISENLNLWADKNSVATIFRNLINNALKFTPESGQVQIFGEEKEGMGVISIQDSGMGMDESKIYKILDTHNYSSSYGTGGEKGLGLGLKLVQEFVKMNNGQISIESQEGEGTTFTITLPLFEEAKVLMD